MADVQPLRALHYALEKTGGLQPVVAPPYDVIYNEGRTALLEQSPYNVVAIDLPLAADGGDPYEHAAETLAQWRAEGAVVQDEQPALWPLEQDYVGPDGRSRTRRGFLARVRVDDYGPGRIRPHERTHPGPKEDRLRLTRATRANLSPIFALFSDPEQRAWQALAPSTENPPWGQTVDPDGTVNRLWRVDDPAVIAAVQEAASDAELLIADGHHRYETARVYAEEIGGDGPHRYVLMCLVALEDPGLTVFPTHRLVRNLTEANWDDLRRAIEADFTMTPLDALEQLPPAENEQLELGYIDVREKRPYRLVLRDPAIADAAMPERSEPYRRLDTAVTELLLLKGALGMTDDQIDHLDGLGYARDDQQAIELVLDGEYDAALFMAPTPVRRVQDVASSGESMPPKSTYFFPKVPTGLVFNPLAD
ncbi:MAG TPA: DUF1015 domain-containing protein [Solirubrobacteraceae bacterium]|jgi:uncharacterized protein (DUF1015 family)|nr:DUF1015 domain-containing protein [Solirubrobacteraceae bacterium]